MNPPRRRWRPAALPPPRDIDQAKGLSDAARLARLEAVLFVAREALSYRRLAGLANLIDATQARTLVAQLIRRYDDRGRAFQIENVAGGVQLLSRPQFAPWITKLSPAAGPRSAELKLTAPALDTLTVVAYRQPVLRVEVEAIRGVGCGELLRQLIDRDLLRIVGRSEELGRPLEYGTTKRFLQMFGLKNLGDLPPMDVLPSLPSARSNSGDERCVDSNVKLTAA